MTQPITLFGATGSIGRSTIDVIAHYPERFHVHAVEGGARVTPLVEVCRRVKPKRAVISDASRLDESVEALKGEGLGLIEVGAGAEAVTEVEEDPATEVVVQAVVGAVGVASTFVAARAQ